MAGCESAHYYESLETVIQEDGDRERREGDRTLFKVIEFILNARYLNRSTVYQGSTQKS